jgi:hypothetical protein
MARPTKYNKEMLEIAESYLTTYNSEHNHLIPSIVGLSEVLEVTAKTLYNWSDHDDRKEFLHMLEKIQQRQQRILIENGLTGDFNAAITKLALTKHGYSDKVEQDVTTGGEKISNNFQIMPVTTKKD